MSSWDTHLYWSTIMQVKLRYRHITEGSTLPSSCLLPFPNLQHSSFSNEKHCSFPRRVTIHCLHTCVDAQTLAVQCHNPSDHLLLCPVWQPVSVLLLVSHLSDYLQPCGSSQSRAKSSEGRLTSPWIWSTLRGEGVLVIWKIPYQGLAFCLFWESGYNWASSPGDNNPTQRTVFVAIPCPATRIPPNPQQEGQVR